MAKLDSVQALTDIVENREGSEFADQLTLVVRERYLSDEGSSSETSTAARAKILEQLPNIVDALLQSPEGIELMESKDTIDIANKSYSELPKPIKNLLERGIREAEYKQFVFPYLFEVGQMTTVADSKSRDKLGLWQDIFGDDSEQYLKLAKKVTRMTGQSDFMSYNFIEHQQNGHLNWELKSIEGLENLSDLDEKNLSRMLNDIRIYVMEGKRFKRDNPGYITE